MKYMKKFILFFAFCIFSSAALQARTVDVSAAYIGASHFDQVRAGLTMAPTLNLLAGVEAKMINERANERAFEDPIYTVNVPIRLDFDLMKIELTPFYYFKNKSDNPQYQDASAYGINGRLIMTLQDDEVNDLYTHAAIGVSYARQDGTVFYDNDSFANEGFSQMAYTLELHKNFFRMFGFQAAASVFQYPDGITGVRGLRSIMDQQELAFTQTFDVVHDLAKYTVGARITRMWPENNATLYLGYRYGEYYTADPEHSFIVGNSFAATRAISADIAYNHVRTIHNDNKRDIFYARLVFSF